MKYKVIALSVVGKSNKVYNNGETVSDENFEPKEAAKKVKDGFLEPLDKPKEKEDTSKKEESPKEEESKTTSKKESKK